MKKPPTIFDMLADIPKRVIDQNAFTCEELAKAHGVARRTMWQHVRQKLALGEWEKVYKDTGGPRLTEAYRIKATH